MSGPRRRLRAALTVVRYSAPMPEKILERTAESDRSPKPFVPGHEL
jgi:hypothetical protein